MRQLPLATGLLAIAACAAARDAAPAQRQVLTARVYIEADYDKVWERLTRPEAFTDWYTAPCRQFGTTPGDELVWADEEREIYRGRLLWIERGRGLAFEFCFVGFGFDEPMTRVEFELLERGPTVLVAVHHDVTGAPRTSEIISPLGWTKPLSRLKTLLETGRAMPWPEEP